MGNKLLNPTPEEVTTYCSNHRRGGTSMGYNPI